MFFIAGTRTKIKKEKFIGIRFCPNCNGFQKIYAMKVIEQITFFFLPVFWWTKAYIKGCENTHGNKLSKEEYQNLILKYSNFPNEEDTMEIYRFCNAMAKGYESNEENADKIFNQLKDRFDLKGYDEDFLVLVKNILTLQQTQEVQSKIIL